MEIKEMLAQVNFRQPKYIIPTIAWAGLILIGCLLINLFGTEVADPQDKNLETTEYLNPALPEAVLKDGDGIGTKFENVNKSFGQIADYTAVDVIEREDQGADKEEYESKYTEDDLAILGGQDLPAPWEDSTARDEQRRREQEALAELEKVLAQARLDGQRGVMEDFDDDDSYSDDGITATGSGNDESQSQKAEERADADAEPEATVKKVPVASDYFNTISRDGLEPALIKAIIDENITATDGSRVRLRLLDDVEISGTVLPKGTYLYAIMNGFSSQRVKGSISSILVDGELTKVSLTLYDTDGMEGLYVPGSQFRETGKEVLGGATGTNVSMTGAGTGNMLSQLGLQMAQNAYQQTSGAIGKAIRKNRAKLKYGTFVYIINSKDIK